MKPSQPVADEVIELDDSHADSAVELLTAAFENDPGWRHVSGAVGDEHRRCLNVAYRAAWALYRGFRQPSLGVLSGARLAGVALLNEPEVQFPPPVRTRWAEEIRRAAGSEVLERLLQNGREAMKQRPAQPHLYLSTLAVHPDFQGRGYGRALLERTHALSEKHLGSDGVCLETENPQNVPLYEHFGYRVIGRYQYDQVEGAMLFRPNGSKTMLELDRHGGHVAF